MKKTIKESQINDIIQNVLLEFTRGGVKQPQNIETQEEPDYDTVTLGNDPKVRSGKEWAEKGGNFPVVRNGKTFYVSRSVAVSLYCFCQNNKGEWCVLANKRGPGAPNNRGLWNVVCGYLDYGESAEHAAARECWEETGVKIPMEKIQQQGVNSHNLTGAQNVTIRFAAVLDGTTDDYPVSDANCEPGEVSAIAWVPLQYVKRLQWAFGQWHKVGEQAKTTLGYDEKTGQCVNDLTSKINSLKSILRGSNPQAYQLFSQILQDLKDYKTL